MRKKLISKMQKGVSAIPDTKKYEYQNNCVELLAIFGEECQEFSQESAFESAISRLDDLISDLNENV